MSPESLYYRQFYAAYYADYYAEYYAPYYTDALVKLDQFQNPTGFVATKLHEPL